MHLSLMLVKRICDPECYDTHDGVIAATNSKHISVFHIIASNPSTRALANFPDAL